MSKRTKRIIIVLFLIALTFTLSGCASQNYIESPLGEGFSFWDIFVYPMAGVMWCVGKTIGFHNYAVTIIFSTIIVRTIAWPIYAKTNDLQLKMKLVQPQIDAIQMKYKDRQDQESRQRMNMEIAQIYKKNKIGLGGCVMPFVQMPIFLGFYYALRKLPTALATEGHWLSIFTTTTIFGVDMTKEMNAGGNSQKIGVIVLAILVGVTQIVSIILNEIRQKKAQDERDSGIPEYRRPKNNNPNAKSSAMMMKIMLYAMAGMMVLFVIQSPAGLGLYWVIGNIYSTLQAWIGHLTSAKRMEKLKNANR